MRSTRPDELDEINAFRSGFRHGQQYGEVTQLEADAELRSLPISTIPNGAIVDCFCQGSVDGAKGDAFRYLLSYAVTTQQEG